MIFTVPTSQNFSTLSYESLISNKMTSIYGNCASSYNLGITVNGSYMEWNVGVEVDRMLFTSLRSVKLSAVCFIKTKQN